jgi:hypothetical protein
MPKNKSSSKSKSKSKTLKYLPHTNSLSKSKSSIIKIRKKLEDIKPLPSVKKSKMKTKMVLKKLPIKIQDIKNILNIPFNKADYNNITIKSLLYDKYTSDYQKNLELLREQLEQGREGKYKEYYNYLDKIRTHLNKYDIYNMTRDVKNEDTAKYYNELKYLLSTYDPLNMSSEQLIKLKNCLFCNKCITLYNNIIIYEFREAIIHKSDDRVTKNTLKNKLKANIVTYYAIQFVSNIINSLYLHILNGNIIQKIELINILTDDHNNILINNPLNDNVNGDSNTLNSSSLDSKTYIRVKRNKERELYLAYLKNNKGYSNEINDKDIITHEEWDEMTLSRLRKVIKITYVDNGKSFCYAHVSSALYRLWKNSYNNYRDFINPISQKPFTEEDMNTILITLGKRDFRYDNNDDYIGAIKTSSINTRYDLRLNISHIKINGMNYWEIKILYLIAKGVRIYKSNPENFRLIRINISKKMENIDNLLDKIYSLYETNKILGKLIPFKLHPAFVKYNFTTIDKNEEYNNFYNMIFTNY